MTVGNDQYYWRVRPVDALGNKRDWDAVQTWTFRRHWPDQPVLEFPANNAVVGDPFHYQWTAVEHASNYVIELSRAPDFTPNSIVATCTTVHTTFVPRHEGECWPGASGTYYWRVTGVDAPGRTVDGASIVTDAISAQIGRFTYDPTRPESLAPDDGATVEMPTMRWRAVPGAASYRVTLTATDGGSGAGVFSTTATSFTPRSRLTVGKSYRWTVQTVNGGRLGSPLTAGTQPTFTVGAAEDPVATSPEPVGPPNGSGSYRFPTLSWTPVVGATTYRVLIRSVGGLGYSYLPDVFQYPAGEDGGTQWLTPGDYEWKVEAWSGGNLLDTSTSSRTFEIKSLDAVVGQRVAITGTSLGATPGPTSCSISLPAQCQDLRQTPVLRWTPQPDAGAYRVFIARDKEMTNIVAGYPQLTQTNVFTPPSALIDSQAGSAFYWFVQPCKSGSPLSGCSALEHAGHAFNKLSNPVELGRPLNNAVESNDVTFTWGDYLATNQDRNDPNATDDTGVHSRIEAYQYRVQVATDPNFQTVLETTVVDQTTFTSYSNTYPEGTLYWRVQAIDGSQNSLAWSPTRTFLKKSPKPVPASPTGEGSIPGWQPFRWEPLAFAGSYEIEVYKDFDLTGSSTNRVMAGNSKQVAFSPELAAAHVDREVHLAGPPDRRAWPPGCLVRPERHQQLQGAGRRALTAVAEPGRSGAQQGRPVRLGRRPRGHVVPVRTPDRRLLVGRRDREHQVAGLGAHAASRRRHLAVAGECDRCRRQGDGQQCLAGVPRRRDPAHHPVSDPGADGEAEGQLQGHLQRAGEQRGFGDDEAVPQGTQRQGEGQGHALGRRAAGEAEPEEEARVGQGLPGEAVQGHHRRGRQRAGHHQVEGHGTVACAGELAGEPLARPLRVVRQRAAHRLAAPDPGAAVPAAQPVRVA